jgi:cytochrome P450
MTLKPQLPPGPKTLNPLGHLLDMADNPLKMLKLAAPYGDVSAIRLFNRYIFLLSNPDHIKHILVDNNRNYIKGRALVAARTIVGNGLLTSEGEFHTRQRRMIQPAFHRQRIAHYGKVMTDYTERQMSTWADGEQRDLHHELMTLTMMIVAKCLFDADVSNDSSRVGQALGGLLDDFSPLQASAIGKFLQKLPTPKQRRRKRNATVLDEVVYNIITERRAHNEDKGDLLSMLLNAHDEEDEGGMTDEQIRDEVMTLFLAGHETTANALSWTFYLLTQNPTVEPMLHAELEAVLAGRLPTVDDLPQLTYTRMVVAEAMRLYPPAWVVGRQALGDDRVGGYTIPAGATVLVSPYITHRNPVYWDQPEVFSPQRFAPGNEAERHRYAYFPFGGGPRVCIGEPFAWMEGVLLTAAIAQQFRFKLAPGAVIEPEPSITLRLKYGLPVIVQKR